MAHAIQVLSVLLFCMAGALSFTGDDRFIKKYAMMKVYESCFGQEVVKEVRKEMKAAAAKCAGISPSAPAPMQVKIHPPQSGQLLGQRHKPQSQDNAHHQMNFISVEHTSGGSHNTETATHASPLQISDQTKPPGVDISKLQQAILAGLNKQFTQQQQQQPQQHFGPTHQFRPYYQPPAFTNVYYPQQSMYQQPFIPNPYYQPPTGMFPYQGSYRGQRGSRDLDVRGQLETLATQVSGKVRNVTCIMQELGYLDVNLEPDYPRMIERIGRLPVQEDLKKDMIEGVDFCRQFSQCLPEDKKDRLVREMVRPMFFFRCYKHKKLEACIMKDVRDRYAASEEMAEDNLTGSENRAAKEFPEDNMSSAIHEFLYGDEHESDGLL